MPRVLFTLCLMAATHGAQAAAQLDSDCGDLGLRSAYLTAHFCAELEALATGSGTARGIGADSASDPGGVSLPEWPEIDILQEAYRNDPRKTLDLIERIKNAGGLTPD